MSEYITVKEKYVTLANNYSYYIIEYKNGEKADCVTDYWLKMLTRFRRIKRIIKRTVKGDISIDEVIKEMK